MRKRRSLTGLVVLGVLVVVAAGAAFYYWPQIFSLIQEERLRSERIARWKLASRGQPLPGTPDLSNLPGRLADKGLKLGDPVFVRIFKNEFELEVWMKRDGRFQHFATYPICMWSGDLGPKIKEGDRQAPEGFYTVDASALNPNSQYHLSFNLGFPNAFDRAHGRTGSFLMVHGNCMSSGCYAMTDPVIDEIWTLVTAALKGGQQRFQTQVFPFRMTEGNMKLHDHADDMSFWQQLKPGFEYFERTHLPPDVSVCQGRYAFRDASGAQDGSTPIEKNCPPAES